MHVFYFGDRNAPLYGVAHEPASATRSAAIVIHQPLGHEYYRTHQALLSLADALAARGYYVLRYDYAGSGDSAGDLDEFTLRDWIAHARLASDEILSYSSCESVIEIGVRFGAAIALAAASPHTMRRYFWDPVFDGQQWLTQMRELQQRVVNDSWWFRHSRHRDCQHNELLGSRFSDDALQAISSCRADEQRLNSAMALYTSANAVENSLPSALTKEIISDQGDWFAARDIERVMAIPALSKRLLEALA